MRIGAADYTMRRVENILSLRRALLYNELKTLNRKDV